VGVSLARNDAELCHGLSAALAVGRDAALVQRYIRGVAASVSLLANGTDAVPLTVNGQTFDRRRRFSYCGGITPLDHPLAHRAAHQARRACEAIGGLRGYVGVDLILTRSEAVVIEINPRLTTAYLGVRAAIDTNIAELALAACAGRLPDPMSARRQVRFRA
jgi:predicted ATP-grasp superfamily ATP-dependent carboligase